MLIIDILWHSGIDIQSVDYLLVSMIVVPIIVMIKDLH